MDIVIDTSALLAIVVAEPERNRLIDLTSGHTLIGPGSIPWEVGNAFSSMLKQRRLSLKDAQRGMEIFLSIPVRYVGIDLSSALSIASRSGSYAYDAYFLDCALRHNAPLLTLDGALTRAAKSLGVATLEV